MYLFEREREKLRSPIYWFTSAARAAQSKARSQQLFVGLFLEWQGSKHLSHSPLPPQAHQQEVGAEAK